MNPEHNILADALQKRKGWVQIDWQTFIVLLHFMSNCGKTWVPIKKQKYKQAHSIYETCFTRDH